MKKVDVKIDEEDKILLILTSLVNSCYNFVDMILYRNEIVTLEWVEEVLMSHAFGKRIIKKYR